MKKESILLSSFFAVNKCIRILHFTAAKTNGSDFKSLTVLCNVETNLIT